MHAQVRIGNVSDSLAQCESSQTASSARGRHGAFLAWREEARAGGHNPLTAEVTHAQLRVAVAEIFKAVSEGLRNKQDSARDCMQRAGAILRFDPWFARVIQEFDLSNRRGSKRRDSKPALGGLAPVQIRRITTHIDGNLAATIHNRDLAAIVRLSPSHFSRVFKASFADTPHRYIMGRRIERAKALMLTTGSSLGRIAAECGFSDQPHFNRLFRQLNGESPRAWRRERECDLQDRDGGALKSTGIKRLESLHDAQAEGERPRRRHRLNEIGVLGLNG
jgi:AraC family transcriptional regulator